MLRLLCSLLYQQTSGQACFLKRATPIYVNVGAAATVVIYSLDASMSPPVQSLCGCFHRLRNCKNQLPSNRQKQKEGNRINPKNKIKLAANGQKLVAMIKLMATQTNSRMPYGMWIPFLRPMVGLRRNPNTKRSTSPKDRPPIAIAKTL